MLGVLHAVADAKYYEAKRTHAVNVGALVDEGDDDDDDEAGTTLSSFSLAADLNIIAMGIARAKARVDELHRLEMEMLRASIRKIRTAKTFEKVAPPKLKSTLSRKGFVGIGAEAAAVEGEEPSGPPPEIDALIRKREKVTKEMTEHAKAVERFLGAKLKVEKAMKKGGTIKKTMGELRRRKIAPPPVVAMFAAVLALLHPTNKGIRDLLEPGTYHLPRHENQILTVWMQLKPFIDPLRMLHQMVAFHPERIGDEEAAVAEMVSSAVDVSAAERERMQLDLEEGVREAFNAGTVLANDWTFEAVTRAGAAFGAIHEWTMVTCSVRRERQITDDLRAEMARIDEILSAAGWEVTTTTATE